MANPIIACQGLSKQYQGTTTFALKDLTLQVAAGEVYGFLGPNGAGKSTAIRTLMNFIQPSAGSATILGKDIVEDSVAIRRHIGYLSSDMAMYPKMTGAQFLAYMGELQPPASQAYQKALLKRFKAQPNKKLGELSRGNRQKIAIVQAFMHQPTVLILDEPTSGLDPLMQEEFYKLVLETKQRGATIFVSSHILSEVQKLCDRVGIIRDGKLVGEYTIAELAQEATQTFDVTFAGRPPIGKLKKVAGIRVASHDGSNVTLHVQGSLQPLLAELAKHAVVKLDARQLDLEELFLRFYESEEKS